MLKNFSLLLLVVSFFFNLLANDKGEALFKAIRDHNELLVSQLLEQGVDPNIRSEEGNYPIILSSAMGFFSITASLLKAGAVPNVLHTIQGTGALSRAVALNHKKVAQLLLAHGAIPQLGEAFTDVTPLFYSAEREDIVTAQILIDHGADVNQWSSLFHTPLQLAYKRGHFKMVSFLLEQGANPFLVKKGLGVRIENLVPFLVIKKGNEKLFNNIICSKYFLSHLNIQNEKGESLLIVAVKFGRLGIVSRLLELGADISLKDEKGRDALEWAKCLENDEIYSLLKKKEEELNPVKDFSLFDYLCFFPMCSLK